MDKFELSRLTSYDDASLLAELRRVAALITTPAITQAEFDKHSKASASTIRNRFGGWQQALAVAGLGDRYSGIVISREPPKTYSDDELIAELRRVAEKLGVKKMTMEMFNTHASINPETIRRRFGSWWKAMQRAGLEISNHGKRHSDNDYFENLLAVWTHHGRQPSYGEMDKPPSTISSGAYEAKWGTWRKALVAFIERVNSDIRASAPKSDEVETEQIPSTSPLRRRTRAACKRRDEDRRTITLGLRYDILRRDHFRCVICGRSPSTDLGCHLHVDHIKPFSAGGPTVIDNLQTLCERCNLGKSAKL
jgi:5-methylcytosine-specific restriction endonuclease McrA